MSDQVFKKMPLIWHLKELRRRLIYCVLIYAASCFVCYQFSREIYTFLCIPLLKASHDEPTRKLIFTGLTEAFFTFLKVSLFGGAALSFPFIITQLYLFIAPGLYRHERRNVLPYILASSLLFIAGGLLVYYYVMPIAWEFFLSFESPQLTGDFSLHLEARVSEYLSLVISLIIGFGLAFQLPVIIVLLVHLAILDSRLLKKYRRYAIVLIFVAAAILTPPDVISQISLAIPMLLLYELSIVICSVIDKKRKKNDRPKNHSGNPRTPR